MKIEKKVITLIGQKNDIEQSISELKSNIQYDNLEVKIIIKGEKKCK